MLIPFETIRGTALEGSEGTLGQITDLFFDDTSWHARYLVIDTGGWLSGQRVLLIPGVIEQADWFRQRADVALSREQVRNAPDVETHRPVSRQQEIELMRHYGWHPYWAIGLDAAPPVMLPPASVPPPVTPAERRGQSEEDSHLRSAHELAGYHVSSEGQEVGSLTDLLVDDQSWQIRYLVVSTGHWFSHRKAVLATEWAGDISWDRRSVTINVPREQIQHSPPYESGQALDDAYERELYRHYGKEGERAD